MNSQPDFQKELFELCDRLLDGELADVDRARLEELVLGNAEARRVYVEYLHLHAALRQNATRLDDLSLSEVLRALPEPAPIARPRFSWPLKLAAGLIVSAGVWALAPRLERAEPSLATLVEVTGARWESSSLPTEPGSPLGRGRLRLAEGLARIVFRSGAEVSLEGPGELELVDKNGCFLHAGALVAHVPESAHGFVVATNHVKLIDHGTDFGMSADATGAAQVQVLHGAVELRHNQSREIVHLASRESASVTSKTFNRGTVTESEPDRYAATRAVKSLPTLALTTAAGNGDATYAASPASVRHYSDTLLLLKNAPDKAYMRKAFLRFDLAPLGGQRVSDARLTLNFESTGFGYSTLTGDCTFAVYGVTDDSQDAWSHASLNWLNAPAFAPQAGEVDLQRAVKLGTFSLPRGVVNGAFSVSGAALADFLNADANRLATLVVLRETSVSNLNSVVHGFAGNRHPTLAPPTLRLTLAQP